MNLARNVGAAGKAAAVLWIMIFVAVSARVAIQPHRNDVFPTYRAAGEHWLNSQPLYEGAMGFVYSPPIGAALTPFAFLPQLAGDIFWRFVSVVALLLALAWWHHAQLPPRAGWPVVLVLLAIFALGNVNDGQANLLLASALLGTIAAVKETRWMAAAMLLAFAAWLKVYPLALGLCLLLVYPRQLAGPLLLWLLIFGLSTFVLQHPGYVLAQYHSWISTRAADNRLHWAAVNAPQDLWRLLRPFGLSETTYRCIQLASAAVVAAVTLHGRVQKWPANRLLVSIFTLSSAWMVLCGPATESATYVLLAPAIIFAVVQAFRSETPRSMQLWILLVLICELLALAIISFTPWRHSPIVLVQPFGALLFFVYGLVWAESRGGWKVATVEQTQPDDQ
ncbi:MAG: DUF2029 domain-containing protein [Verrucomicrobia bacterium]|nr:DUF2029 domain-containing protein [Verrucomicrobiota bacterium]